MGYEYKAVFFYNTENSMADNDSFSIYEREMRMKAPWQEHHTEIFTFDNPLTQEQQDEFKAEIRRTLPQDIRLLKFEEKCIEQVAS